MSLFKTLFSQTQTHKYSLSTHQIYYSYRPFSVHSVFREDLRNQSSEPTKPIFWRATRTAESGNEDGGGGREPSEVKSSFKSLGVNETTTDSENKGFLGILMSQSDKRVDENVKVVPKDLKLLASHLCNYGYLKNGLDFSYIGNNDLMFVAEKFGKDYQEIAKWISGNHLKKVALFGCPCLSRKSVFAAKRLRKFFRIQEDTVCKKCVLNQSCKFVNQNVWKIDTKKLILTDVMNVITPYVLEKPLSPQLVVPSDIKASISRLLNEVVSLSRTTSKSI